MTPLPDPNSVTGYGYNTSPPTFHVHQCRDDGHHAHRLVGMRDPDVYYLMTVNGCIGDVIGYATEAEARAAGEVWLAAALAYGS